MVSYDWDSGEANMAIFLDVGLCVHSWKGCLCHYLFRSFRCFSAAVDICIILVGLELAGAKIFA